MSDALEYSDGSLDRLFEYAAELRDAAGGIAQCKAKQLTSKQRERLTNIQKMASGFMDVVAGIKEAAQSQDAVRLEPFKGQIDDIRAMLARAEQLVEEIDKKAKAGPLSPAA